jgi:hypothetical protein
MLMSGIGKKGTEGDRPRVDARQLGARGGKITGMAQPTSSGLYWMLVGREKRVDFRIAKSLLQQSMRDFQFGFASR